MTEMGTEEPDHSMAPKGKTPPSPIKSALFVFSLSLVGAAIAVICNSYVFTAESEMATAQLDKLTHCLVGIVLGAFLVLRLAVALFRLAQAKAAVAGFYAACATLAVSSANVQEVLTISAGAEHEKQGILHFRTELARLLGFAARCFGHAAKGEPVVPDATLMTVEDTLAIRSPSKPTPTLFAIQLITKLVAQQRDAGRLDQMLCMHMNTQLAGMVRGFQEIATAKTMSNPPGVYEFANAWLIAFGLTLPVVISSYTYTMPWVAPVATLIVISFYFGVNELAAHVEDLPTALAFEGDLVALENQLRSDLAAFVPQQGSQPNGAGGML